jgi:hypothetical protein
MFGRGGECDYLLIMFEVQSMFSVGIFIKTEEYEGG